MTRSKPGNRLRNPVLSHTRYAGHDSVNGFRQTPLFVSLQRDELMPEIGCLSRLSPNTRLQWTPLRVERDRCYFLRRYLLQCPCHLWAASLKRNPLGGFNPDRLRLSSRSITDTLGKFTPAQLSGAQNSKNLLAKLQVLLTADARPSDAIQFARDSVRAALEGAF